MTNCGLDSFGSQILPGQIRVQKGDGDSTHTARGAIVHEFHGPHRTSGEEVESSGFEWDEIADFLTQSFPTSRASDLSDALWTNSNLVHYPDNREIFATLRTGGNKLIVHKESSFLPPTSPFIRMSEDGGIRPRIPTVCSIQHTFLVTNAHAHLSAFADIGLGAKVSSGLSIKR
jgi:hypothetical protein